MKASLQLKIGHNLTMTPQLQQAIRLLQLSSMELSVEIQEALESNMMLETAEESPEEPSASENSEENVSPAENILDVTQDMISVSEPENIPDELAVDSVWEDTYESSAHESSGNVSTNYENSQLSYESQNCNDETLKEHLLWQLNLIPISDTDKAIATTIIDALDDDGYLNCDLD
ncbi:MAG: RNA polymerase factor sigma-54, partial [Gammaproteobacteria bacterium]|nr:RNA polymerase factor sigma-54 [Gammaproteobacteria bacterium]